MRLFLSTALAALIATSVMAQPTPEPAKPTETNTVSSVTVNPTPAESVLADDPIVCRKAPETGSRVRAMKQCRKRSEWAAKGRARNSNQVNEIRMGDCGGGGGSCDTNPLPPQ